MPTPVPMINSTEDKISHYNQQAKLDFQEQRNAQPQPQISNFIQQPSPDDVLNLGQMTRKDSQVSVDGSMLKTESKDPETKQPNSYQPYQTTSSVTMLETLPEMMSKANLIFEGEPLDMTLDWSEEELSCRRRLVQFWRRHDNSDIYCTFRPMVPGTRPGNNIVVSCIFWDEKNDWFITSVDCIHLLESLISVRFTVEEKNRIRRNLEGFRPLTVSKCKRETAEFFKLIMAFPNPKPRNIEKDVKVFPWRVLSFALKKIVNKYATGFAPGANQSASFNGQNPIPRQHSVSNQHHALNSSQNFNIYSPYAQNTDYAIRANYHRRYSQPANMLMGMYNQPLMKPEIPDPTQDQQFFPRTSQGVSNFVPGHNFPIGQLAMPTISEKPNFADFNHPHNFNQLQQENAQRRHSLADPYSFQRSQYRQPLNLQPLVKLDEEPGNSNQFSTSNSERPNYAQPSGLAIIDESQLSSFKSFNPSDQGTKSSQANQP